MAFCFSSKSHASVECGINTLLKASNASSSKSSMLNVSNAVASIPTTPPVLNALGCRTPLYADTAPLRRGSFSDTLARAGNNMKSIRDLFSSCPATHIGISPRLNCRHVSDSRRSQSGFRSRMSFRDIFWIGPSSPDSSAAL